jgi:hypothetical protein
MTNRYHKVTGGFVVVNAIDHASSAEGKALACVVFGSAGHGITEFEKTIPIKDQSMR